MTYEFEGKTEKDAIEKAVAELNLNADQFDVEILETQKKSLFKSGHVKIRVIVDDEDSGMKSDENDASRPVSGKLIPQDEFEQKLVDFIRNIIERMGYSASVDVFFREDKKIGIRLDSDSSSILIGRKGQNTGVLILFVLDSHDIRIMTGVGIEGVLTDAQCSKIIHDDMTPAFRAGQYGDGLCLGALRIYEICTDGEAPEELLSIRSVTNRGEYGEDELTDAEIMGIIGVFTGLFILIALILYWASVKRCPKCGKRRAHATREQVLVAATYASAGQGLRTYCCRNCGNTFNVTFVIPRRQRTVYVSGGGRSGMGGFGGGGSWGGGSTFGGGAGGKW